MHKTHFLPLVDPAFRRGGGGSVVVARRRRLPAAAAAPTVAGTDEREERNVREKETWFLTNDLVSQNPSFPVTKWAWCPGPTLVRPGPPGPTQAQLSRPNSFNL